MARVLLDNTTTTAIATSYSYERAIVKTTLGKLVLFANISGTLNYKTSSDNGVTWDASWTSVETGYTVYEFDTYIDTTNDIYIVYRNSFTNHYVTFRKLTYSGGSWTIGARVNIINNSSTVYHNLSLTKDTGGYLWVALTRQDGYFFAYKSNNLNYTTWTQDGAWSDGYKYGNLLIPVGSNIWLLTQRSNKLVVYKYTGTWDAGSNIVASGITNDVTSLGGVKISDTEIYVAGRTTSGIKVFKYNGSIWDTGTLISNHANDASPALTNKNNIPVIVWKDYDPLTTYYNIYYSKYNGSTWDDEIALTNDSAIDAYPSVLGIDSASIYFCYTTGSSSPYSVYFDLNSFSTTVQQSILSNAKIKSVDNQQSLLSNAKIVDRTQQSLLSDATIKIIDIQNNILSDAKIKSVDNQQSILSDATIISSIQQSIPSDAKIKAIDIPQSINSDAKIKSINNQQNILSDAKIKSTGNQQSILSDARIFVPYLSKFIYNETIFIVTDTDPCDIIKVDISGGSPTYTKYTVTSYKNAKNLVIDVDNLKFYFSCNNGKVIKASTLNPSTREVFDVGEDKQLNTITRDNEYAITYIGDNEAGTSLFIVDEAIYAKINTDFRTRKSEQSLINTWFETLHGIKINSDFRTLKQEAELINTDLRFNIKPYTEIPLYPLARTDFHVYIGGIQLTDNDLKLDSIRINHTADSRSTAEFVLLRKHDDLNNPTTITNNNTVAIYIKNKLDFTGRIINLNCSSANETVSVQCESSTLDLDYNSVTKDLPLTKLNSQIHLYDVLLNDVTINKPCYDSNLLNIGLFENTLQEIKDNIAIIDNNYLSAFTLVINKLNTLFYTLSANLSNSQPLPAESSSYISNINTQIFEMHRLLSSYRGWGYSIVTPLNSGISEIEYNFQFIRDQSGVDSLGKPLGVRVNLGNHIDENVIRFSAWSIGVRGEDIENGKWQPWVGFEYFWYVTLKKYDMESPLSRVFYHIYIGNSLGPVSTDIYEILNANGPFQAICYDSTTHLGYYTIGLPPYKDISVTNGVRHSDSRWVDKEDGLYSESEASYDYTDYCKAVARIEYSKILNINNAVSPETKANIDMTIDAYLYYGLKLLTRINLINTTVAGIYQYLNGFPVSIKQIIIDSNTMKITLNTDNNKSAYEITKLSGFLPRIPPVHGMHSSLHTPKYDLPNETVVDGSDLLGTRGLKDIHF